MSNFNLFYGNNTASVLQPLLKIRKPKLKLKNLRFIAKISPGILRAVNQTMIKGGCQLGRKVVPHNSKRDLPLDPLKVSGFRETHHDLRLFLAISGKNYQMDIFEK